MLQVLADMITQRETVKRPLNPQLQWIKLSDEDLQSAFPFWVPVDIKRVQNSLQALGVLLIDPLSDASRSNYFAIDDNSTHDSPAGQVTRPDVAPKPKPAGTASLIPTHWQPDDNWVKLCKQQSIPEAFLRDLVPEFVNYWRERGQARFSWGNAFYKHALKKWRNEQTRPAPCPLTGSQARTPWAFWRMQQSTPALSKTRFLSLCSIGANGEPCTGLGIPNSLSIFAGSGRSFPHRLVSTTLHR